MAQNKRTDEQGRAFKGSQLQVQIYVNRRKDELNKAIFEALPDLKDSRIRWVSPIESKRYDEFKDNDFLKAVTVDWKCLSEKLATFWPKGGPVWDALAIAEGKTKGIILVEGKNYPEEMQSTCGATDENSLKLITYSLNKTKRWLGIPEETIWTSPLYQYVNRLAHLYFLRQECNVPAWMVNLCFLNDNIHHPTTCSEWKSGLSEARATLRLSNVKIPHHAEVFLEPSEKPAGGRPFVISALLYPGPRCRTGAAYRAPTDRYSGGHAGPPLRVRPLILCSWFSVLGSRPGFFPPSFPTLFA